MSGRTVSHWISVKDSILAWCPPIREPLPGFFIPQTVSCVRAAGGQPGPLHRVLDDRVDPVQLLPVDDRAQGHSPARRIPDGQMPGFLRESTDIVFIDVLVHDVAPCGHADPALVHKGPERRGGGGPGQVRARQDNQRVVAAEFQVRALEQPPGRQPGLLEDPHQRHPAADRRAGVGLEQHGVAEGQRGGDRADGEDQREVERRNHGHDADRAPAGEGPAVFVRGQHVPGREGRQRRGLAAFVGRDVRFQACLGRNAAGLAHDPVLDLGGVLLPEQPGAAQHGGAVLGVEFCPVLLGSRRCAGGVTDVPDSGEAIAAQRRAGGGLEGPLYITCRGAAAVKGAARFRDDGDVRPYVSTAVRGHSGAWPTSISRMEPWRGRQPRSRSTSQS